MPRHPRDDLKRSAEKMEILSFSFSFLDHFLTLSLYFKHQKPIGSGYCMCDPHVDNPRFHLFDSRFQTNLGSPKKVTLSNVFNSGGVTNYLCSDPVLLWRAFPGEKYVLRFILILFGSADVFE